MLRKFISRVFNLPSRNKGTRPKVIPFSQHGIQRDRLSSGALRTIERLCNGLNIKWADLFREKVK